jgi:hypothetical protein
MIMSQKKKPQRKEMTICNKAEIITQLLILQRQSS